MKKLIKKIKSLFTLQIITSLIDGIIFYIHSPSKEIVPFEPVPKHLRIKVTKLFLVFVSAVILLDITSLNLINSKYISLSVFMQQSILNMISLLLNYTTLVLFSLIFILCIMFLIKEHKEERKFK